jgi:hypothetical protein
MYMEGLGACQWPLRDLRGNIRKAEIDGRILSVVFYRPHFIPGASYFNSFI